MDIFQIERAFARQSSVRTRRKRPVSRALTRVDYTVPGHIPALRQHGPRTCWATVATMLLSWRDGTSYDVREAMGQVGATWQHLYDAGLRREGARGLPGSRKAEFLAAAGLQAMPPMNFDAVGWERLLRTYGPLWVTTDVNLSEQVGIHARVLYGIHGDGTADGTTVDLIDPATGTTRNLTLALLQEEFEQEARSGAPLRIQVVHFPAGARRVQTQSVRARRALAFGKAARVRAFERPTCQHEDTTEAQAPISDRVSFATALNMPAPPELEPLLRYLRVDYGEFAPVEARYFDGLKRLLVHHSVCSPSDPVNRTNFRELVKTFQERRENLGHDGIPGEDTLWELQREWAAARTLAVDVVPADVVPGVNGFNRFRLRRDIVANYTAVRAEVQAAGGVITSAGSLRELTAQVTPGRSPTSMHYSGLALDLATRSGMQDPAQDPYIITQEGRFWRVWCRAENGAQRTLEAVRHSRGTTRTTTVTARVIDLTEIFQRHGFQRIGPRSGFPADYGSAEWWHFQCEAALTPFLSQFGAELLSLAPYNQSLLERNTDIWAKRKRIFKRRRNGWW